MDLICRTCLKTDLAKTGYVKILNRNEFNQMVIKDMLEIFMPEMDLEICEGDAVICLQCSELLKNAYMFKNVCLKTEEAIYDYLHRYNINLGKKISLSAVLEEKYDLNSVKNGDTSDLKCSSQVLLTKIESLNGSDSNQSSLNNSVDSETERKVFTVSKTRKRTRTSKKTKKTYNYNSLKRSYTCDLCEYKAYRVDLLDTHKKKHDRNVLSVKEYKCEYCLYSTPRKRALDRHLFTHQGKSRHLCEICKKTFAEKYQLKLHAITHTGQELPHKCTECGKEYLTKSYLKQHLETRHLSQRKERCLECNQHDCEHFSSRYYKCNLCRASFSDKRGLDAHKFTHTGGEFPYKCLHCDFGTAWKGNLKKHIQNKH